MGGWGYSGLVQWLTGPPQAEEDIVYLLSMLIARLRLDTPRINTFSSDTTPGKTEMSFKQWYYGVQCIKDKLLGISSLGKHF